MAHISAPQSLLGLAKNLGRLNIADPLTQCLAPRLTRHFAAQTQIPVTELGKGIESGLGATHAKDHAAQPSSSYATYTLDSPILKTLYSWPDLEPKRYAWYEQQFLDAPMRRDILHRAVIFEADATRQGTASTKWRADVHGSNRKLYAQKGLGRARVRDKKSPIRRGGGVAFGPKPRDFSTELQRKVYYQAFKIALSYRHRKGELTVLDNGIALPSNTGARFLNNVFEANNWGKAHGRSLLVTSTPESQYPELFDEMEQVGEHGSLKDIDDVDVKDLLETGRIVIERTALEALLGKHLTFLSGPEREAERRRIAQYL
ncbi:Large ribosomal subunit protein uL4m [Exophiala dermatitidis]|uniref:Large ribosomal subunit protein uL4m n=1 Tax=Exophiala dermatitidis (strain ATCC 34100 / CBS 525.76 / NIH/UT8656) TaxID=858893 RepID=H6BP37_EXODN|nr:50S ribosomal protein L4 [Exophiala dermatitidis NIH/UT8656]EHY53264.1 50S ribosomal protein L4 [Exophiala dermatitidis NIH/UT8656]